MMCGRKYLVGYLFLLVVLVQPLYLFSDVTLTDQEYNKILTQLKTTKSTLEKQAITIQQLESLQQMQTQTINLLKIQSDLQLTSWKQQKNDQWIQNLKMFGLGFIAGNST